MAFRTEYNRPPSIILSVISIIAGILSFIPGVCFIAIICGALARRYAWADPQRHGGYGMGTIGMSLGGIFLLLWLVLGGAFAMKWQHDMHDKIRLAEQAQNNKLEIDARVTDRDQAEKIAAAARTYAMNDKSKKFPPRLAALMPAGLEPTVLMSAMTKDLPFMPPAGVDWTVYADDIDRSSDFIYVGNGLSVDKVPANDPPLLVYSKSIHGDGRAVAFIDGTARWISNTEMSTLVDITNAIRGSQGLANIMLDVPASDPRAKAMAGRSGGGTHTTVTPEKPHTTFDALDEALTFASDGKPEERKAALAYIERGPADTASHDKVLAKLEPMYADPTYHTAAFRCLKTWATKWDLPLLRTTLEGLVKENANTADPADACIVINLLTKFEDRQASRTVARCLRNEAVRDDASTALKAQGPDAEEAAQSMITDPDSATAVAALRVLGKVGTEKSVVQLHKVLNTKVANVPTAAQEALKEIAERANLKPEQYQYVLFDHFSVTPPAGFIDAKSPKANVKEWSHQSPGRAVKSVFAVEVKAVDKNYKIAAPANSADTLETNGLTLYQLSASSNAASKTVHWAALDGEYLIDINATLDNFDQTSAANMQKAVMAIKVK